VVEEVRQFEPGGVLSVAHLVRRGRIDEYRHAVEAVVLVGAFRVVVGAMRAPYSFASRKGTLAGHDSGSPIRNADG
jgi:hypothetical protein